MDAPTLHLEHHTMENLCKKLIKDELDVIITSGHLKNELLNMGLLWKTAQESYLAIFVLFLFMI